MSHPQLQVPDFQLGCDLLRSATMKLVAQDDVCASRGYVLRDPNTNDVAA